MKRTVFIKSTIRLETEEEDLTKLQVSLLGVSDKDYDVVMQGEAFYEWNPDYPAQELHINFLKETLEKSKAKNQKLEKDIATTIYMLQRLTNKLKEAV